MNQSPDTEENLLDTVFKELNIINEEDFHNRSSAISIGVPSDFEVANFLEKIIHQEESPTSL